MPMQMLLKLDYNMELIRKHLVNFSPYSSARHEADEIDGIFLDANENPFNSNLFNRYPDPFHKNLKLALANYYGLNLNDFVCGNGSDEIIDLIIRLFAEPFEDRVLALSPGYGMYKVICQLNQVEFHEINLNQDFNLDEFIVNQILEINPKIVFVVSPNNPTGNLINPKFIIQLLNNLNGILVIDEAYIEFSSQDFWIKNFKNFNNLILLRTFSKAYGMAGLRIGYAISNPEIIQYLYKIKLPYNINSYSQEQAIQKLNDSKIKSDLEIIIKERGNLISELNKIQEIIRVYPSDANFILIRLLNSNALFDHLKKRGIIVRDRSNLPMCENTLRISIGNPQENILLIKEIKKYFNYE